MRSLVTGGAGFIGSHLVDALLQKGNEVVVLDNLATGLRDNLGGHWRDLEFVRGDIRHPHGLRKAVSEAEVVFHLAASVGRSVRFPRLDFDTNALGTLNVLRACKEEKVDRVVIASSVMVYGGLHGKRVADETDPPAPIIPYGASKAAAEAYAMAFHHSWNLPVVVLRYFNVYGPRASPRNPYSGVVSSFMGRAARGLPPIIFGDGLQTRDFVFVDDVVRATVLAAEREKALGEIINVGSGTATPIKKLALLVLETAGLDNLKLKHSPSRPHEYRHMRARMTKAKTLLGFRPDLEIEEGLNRTWDFIRKMK